MDQIVEFKKDGLCDADIIAAIGVHHSTFVFRGADDPLKLKSVKFTKGYCSVVWFEEHRQSRDSRPRS